MSLVGITVAAGGLTGCGQAASVRPASNARAEALVTPARSQAPFRFFSPRSFWNQPVTAKATLDRHSGQIMRSFIAEVAAERATGSGPSIVTTRWSVPIYTVPRSQPTVRVVLATKGVRALQAAWDSVPLPPDAHPAAGTDEHLVVWQPSTDRLWEFWKLQRVGEQWQASWGGAIRDASRDKGSYGPNAWPGADTHWGGSASSLSLAGGVITLEDLEDGQINHALAMSIPNVRAGLYSLPAERDDGKSTSPVSLPEGAHLRLDPTIDLARLHLPKVTYMIARAAQRYGIFVRSAGGIVDFIAQDPSSTGTEPYGGPDGYFEGKDASEVLESFPWGGLQLLPMKLRRDSSHSAEAR
jgi:hypothetical protein